MARSDFFSSTNLKRDLYSDFPSDINVHPDKNDIVRITNEDAVKSAIRNLILTDKGERFFSPDIGSNIRKLLFEPVSIPVQLSLREFIIETITRFEPRARLITVIVNPREDENAYAVSIVYSLINNKEPTEIQFLLNRIR